MAEDIGNLIVRIAAKTDDFEKGLQKANDKIGSFVGKAAKIGAVIGVGMAAAGAAVFGMAKKASDATDRIDKMSQKIGISRTAFQEWDFILSQTGTNIEGLQMGVKTLSKAAYEASQGVTTYKDSFDELGITVTNTDGTLKEQEILLQETIVALAAMDDETKRTAIASELLGRSATELAPLLNGGSESIENMRKQANDLGLVLSDTAIDAGVKFTDTMDQVKRSLGAAATNIGAELMPMVQKMLDWVIQHMPEIKEVMKNVFEFISNVVKNSSKVFKEHILPALTSFWEWVEPKLPAIKQFFVDAFGVATDLVKGLATAVKDTTKWIQDHWAIVEPILIGIGAGAAAFGLITAAIWLWNTAVLIATATTASFGAVLAFATSPIGLVVLAIAALVAIGVLLYKNWDEISAWFGKLWEGIKETAINVWNSIKEFFVNLWEGIKETATNVWNSITDFFKNMFEILLDLFFKFHPLGIIIKNFGAITDFFKSFGQGVKDIFSGIIDGITSGFKGMVNGVISSLNFMIRALNKLKFSVPDWVPRIGGKGFGFNIPELPKLAKGTNFVPFDTAAFIHKGEAVVPADNNPSNPSASNPIGGDTFNFAGLFDGAVFNVRSDNDAKLIAREIRNLTQGKNRGSGVVPA